MAFERIKEAVDIVEVAQRFGVQVERGRARCFVHDDKTPSLFFRDGRYKCFGCGASGDVFDLVAAVEGVPLLEAARRIDDMYGFIMRPTTAGARPGALGLRCTRKKPQRTLLLHPLGLTFTPCAPYRATAGSTVADEAYPL